MLGLECYLFRNHGLIFFLVCRHTLLDAKITNVLSLCHDQVILSAVQNIIQNMITLEDPSQQQPHYLQSVGFGGLWRFAGPFTKVRKLRAHCSYCFVRCNE